MITKTGCLDFAALVLVGVFAEGYLVEGVRTELEPKQVGAPKSLVQRLHKPPRRAARPHSGQLGDLAVLGSATSERPAERAKPVDVLAASHR